MYVAPVNIMYGKMCQRECCESATIQVQRFLTTGIFYGKRQTNSITIRGLWTRAAWGTSEQKLHTNSHGKQVHHCEDEQHLDGMSSSRNSKVLLLHVNMSPHTCYLHSTIVWQPDRNIHYAPIRSYYTHTHITYNEHRNNHTGLTQSRPNRNYLWKLWIKMMDNFYCIFV